MNKTAKSFAFAAFAVFLFAFDQVAKLFAARGSFGFLNSLRPVLGRQLFLNNQFAFSLPVATGLIYLIDLVLVVALLYWFFRIKNKSAKNYIAIILILVGAFGNIYDRIALGYVRDFIYVFWGNVFNLADIYIVIGIALMIF